MKASELRIGNLIKKGEIERVTIIRENSSIETEVFPYEEDEICLLRFIEDVEGIPLTDEWLLHFGFTKGETVKSWTILKKGEWFTIYDDLEFGGQCIYGRTSIKYVHQLQNLYFALTGTELEIK